MSSGGGAPAFTVLMATYAGDKPADLARAVESIYSNTRRPDEGILVVDGPVPDELNAEIVASEDRHGVTVLRLTQNGGLSAALNHGLARVRTEWTARADSDDINLPERFESQLRFLAEHGGKLDVFGAAIQEIDEDGTLGGIRRPPDGGLEIRRFAGIRNPINHMTAFFRTDLVRGYGGYPGIYLREDYALWVGLIASGARVANMPEVLVHARAGKGMIRRRGGFRYAKGELQLQRLLVEKGFKSRFRGFMDGMARGAVFLAPVPLRGAFYTRFLRD